MLSDELVQGADAAPALVRSNGEATTYGQLRAAVARGAERLRAAGAGPGHPVGIGAGDPHAVLVSSLAAWRVGAAVVPMDPKAGAAWLADVKRRARVELLVKAATAEGDLALDAGEPRPVLDPAIGLVLFTSGSSSAPKGVLLRAAGLLENVDAILEYLPIRQFPRTAIVLPLAYSYALVGQAMTTLRAGGTALLLGDLAYPPLQLDAMTRLEAQGLSSVPTSLRRLAACVNEAPGAPRPRLRYVASAGGASDKLIFDALREAFPEAIRFNQWGLTEASPRVTGTPDTVPQFEQLSVGRPLRRIEVWAADEQGNRLPPGETGELVVRGPSVMVGYLDDPAETARVLSPDGALRTGDAGRVDEQGYVYVSGRLDGVVKIAGERVGVLEVAAALRRATGSREVCVVAVPDAQLGARLVAFVEGPESLLAGVRHEARGLSPAKRPARLLALGALPRTANGKPDLKALRALAEQA